jgi:hypothetical protein
MATVTQHYTEVNDTTANIRTNIDAYQCAIDTTLSRFAFSDDTPTYIHYCAQTRKINKSTGAVTYLDETFDDVTLLGDLILTDSIVGYADDNTYITHTADKWNIATGGINNVDIVPTAVIFNEGGADVDFRIESDTNTYAFVLDGATGNIGIGTAAPARQLHIAEAGDVDLNLALDNNGTNGNEWLLQSKATGDFHLYGAGAARIAVTDSGYVGIGTTAPSSLLHVKATDATCAFTLQHYSAGPDAYGTFAINSAYDLGFAITFNSVNMLAGNPTFVGLGSSATAEGSPEVDVAILTKTGTAMYVDAGTNNIGISVTAPEAKIDVLSDVFDGGFAIRPGMYLRSSVNHGMTDIYPTNVYGAFVNTATGSAHSNGGLSITGLSSRYSGLSLVSLCGNTDYFFGMRFTSAVKSGTGVADVSASDTAFEFYNRNTNIAYLTGEGSFTVSGGMTVGSDKAVYFGSAATDGSWRIVRSGTGLYFERRESGSWVTKSTLSA